MLINKSLSMCIGEELPAPIIKSSRSGNKTTRNKTTTVSIPNTRAVGDLIVIVLSSAGTSPSTPSTPSGWTRLATATGGFLNFTVFYRYSAGNETSVSFTTSTDLAAAFNVFVISGAGVIQCSNAAGGNAGAARSPAFTHTSRHKNTLWLTVMAKESNTAAMTAPSGWSGFGQVTVVRSSYDEPRVAWAHTSLKGNYMHPPRFGVNIQRLQPPPFWRAFTIAVTA